MSKRFRSRGESSSNVARPNLVIPVVNGVQVFENDEVYLRYNEMFATRSVIRERGINLVHCGSILQGIVDKYRLGSMVIVPDEFNGTLVKEIFAYISVYPYSNQVKVRGVTFELSAKEINRVLNTRRQGGSREYGNASKHTDRDHMIEIANTMGFEWPRGDGGRLVAMRTGLFSNEWRNVHKFVVNRIFPSGHKSSAPTDYVEMMHWLSQGQPLDFGELIIRRIHVMAESKVDALGFGSLLTRLAYDGGVVQYGMDEKIKKLPDIGDNDHDDLPFDPQNPPQRPRRARSERVSNEMLSDKMDYLIHQMHLMPYPGPNWRNPEDASGQGGYNTEDEFNNMP